MNGVVPILLILASQSTQTAGPSLNQRTTGDCSPAVAEVNGNVQLTLTCPASDPETRRELKRAVDLLQRLLSASEDSEPISTTFPVTYFLRTSDHLPLVVPGRPFPTEFLPYFDKFLDNRPEAASEDGEAAQLYHEFLQKSLFEWLAMRYHGTWRIERHKFDTGTEFWGPAPGSEKEESLVLSTAELDEAFKENRFAPFHLAFGKLALPPGSTLAVQVPQKAADHGRVTISNRFCELEIDTVRLSSGRSFGGYGTLLGIPVSARNFWTHEFVVRIRVGFTKSPPASDRSRTQIKQWARDIVNGLQTAFDEQVIWPKTIENLRLLIQQWQTEPNLVQGLGPIKFAKP